MKKYLKVIALCSFGVLFNSCDEEKILELSPINRISLDQAFTSPSLIESSMNGVYNAAAVGQYNTTNPNGGRGYLWGAAFIQQGDCRGEDVVNTATFYEFTYTAQYDATTANNTFYWVDGYRLINRCNLMIEGVTTAVANGVITQAVANNYIGQSRFLRAITHFELLTYFARPYNFTAGATHLGIPYRTTGIDSEPEIAAGLAQQRNTVADCYNKVLADLDAAEALITNTNLFKASKNAAIAFKTRVKLHQRDWSGVITEGLKLNALALTPAPNTPFVIPSAPNTESIFSIQQGATAGQNAGVNGALASQYKRRVLVCISPIIWRNPSWLVTDKRREEGVMVVTQGGRKYTNKYKDDVNYTDAAPVIRYAEVLLNMAEAYARQSNLPAALTNLNLVRNRSLANPTTEAYTSASFTTNATMVGAILTERRIEFVMEGRRWSDIHRLQGDDLQPIVGIPAKVGNGNPPAADFVLGTPYSGPLVVAAINDFRFLWPIPQIEIVNNPTLAAQQNPGW
jgi:hypothetical protein